MTFSRRWLWVLVLVGLAACSSRPPVKEAEAPAAPTAAKRSTPLPKILAPGAQVQATAAAAQYQQALSSLKAGQDDQALVLLRDISHRYPALTGPVLNQALLLRRKGRLTEAEALLKSSMNGPSQDPRIMNLHGVICRELGRFDQARISYQGAITLAPDYDRPHYNLAVLADLYLNDLPLAIEKFEAYQALQDTRDRRVDGWIKDLKRRAAR